MRPLLHGDLTAAARALLPMPPGTRFAKARTLMRQADTAHAFMQRTGAPHPRYGNGSLMAAALARGAVREPSLDNPDYRHCLIAVLQALQARARESYPRAQVMHRVALGSSSRRGSAIASPQSSQ